MQYSRILKVQYAIMLIKSLISRQSVCFEIIINKNIYLLLLDEDLVKLDLLASLKDLRVDYVDSFVIHWPQACPKIPGGKKPALASY